MSRVRIRENGGGRNEERGGEKVARIHVRPAANIYKQPPLSLSPSTECALTPLRQLHLPVDPHTKSPKGTAYIRYTSPTSALSAYESLDNRSFQGRLLHIIGAVDRHGNTAVENAGADGKKRSVKDERAENRKKGAGKEFSWGMLYMNVRLLSSPPLLTANADLIGCVM